ncbi:MAG: VIT domain-containing protein, partial [Planctomycetota bacterium]
MRLAVAAALIPALLGTLVVGRAEGAGMLTPTGSPQQPIQIKDHSVSVVINNGFARTEVNQTFHNPNDRDLEAIYSFPVPQSASLSEVTVYIGEKQIDGEVVRRKKARQIYEQEKRDGKETGLAEKNGYQTFEFAVSPVRAGADTRLRFVYYQPLKLDTGVGRYLYPLEEGGTDEMASQFWTPNTRVEGTFSAEVELKSAWPVASVRVPGFDGAAKVERLD